MVGGDGTLRHAFQSPVAGLLHSTGGDGSLGGFYDMFQSPKRGSPVQTQLRRAIMFRLNDGFNPL